MVKLPDNFALLDPNSKQQVLNMALQGAIEELEKGTELLAKECLDLGKRVKGLEDARQRQIALNASFVSKPVNPLPKSETSLKTQDFANKRSLANLFKSIFRRK